MMLNSGHVLTATMINIKTIYVVMHFLAFAVLCLPLQSYAEDALGPSSFMDLKSSVELVLSEVSRARKSIVIVVAYDSSGVARRGSGVFIDAEGRIIVNANVLENAYAAEVFSESNHYEKVAVLGQNKSIDIALLQVDAVSERPIELDYEHEIQPGERVIVVGRSVDYKTTVLEGLISNLKNIDEALDFIEIETTTGLSSYQRSKDGSVLNMDGKVIGIIAQDMSKYKGELFPKEYYGAILDAVTISSIKPMVSGPYEIEYFHPPGTKIWSHWFQRELKESIISAFITLYQFGFKRIMGLAVMLLLLVVLVIWILSKFKLIKLHK